MLPVGAKRLSVMVAALALKATTPLKLMEVTSSPMLRLDFNGTSDVD
jgi:hypothetical protein